VLLKLTHLLLANATDAEKRAMNPVFGGLVVGSVLDIALSLLCLSLCITWLVFTASPNRRARSCGGNRVACVRHSCDMGCDITWAVLWGLSTILRCMSFNRSQSAATIAAQMGCIFLGALLFGTFTATAVISGKIRKEMHAAAAARDIESTGYSTDGSTAAQVPGKALNVAPATTARPARS